MKETRKCTYKDVMKLLDVSARTAQRYLSNVRRTLPSGTICTIDTFRRHYGI